jgi:hypothetical protein
MIKMKPFSLPYRALLLVALCLPQPAPARAEDVSSGSVFKLRPELNGPYRYAEVIDVSLGNSPEAFVRPAYGQTTGREPGRERVAAWAARLRTDAQLRRIGVVRTFCVSVNESTARADGSPTGREVRTA